MIEFPKCEIGGLTLCQACVVVGAGVSYAFEVLRGYGLFVFFDVEELRVADTVVPQLKEEVNWDAWVYHVTSRFRCSMRAVKREMVVQL